MHRLKARKIGNSIGFTVPKEELARLHIKEGDTVYLVETPDGMELTPYDPEFAASMEAFGQTRRKYRNALRELAK